MTKLTKYTIFLIFIISLGYSSLSAQCVGTQGQISWHYWSDIPYYEIESFYHDDTYPNGPDATRVVNSLRTPINYDDHIGSITKGFVSVPESGPVTFNMTADHEGYFMLSTDSTKANIDTLISVPEPVGIEEYNVFPSQTSQVVNMVAGTKYYFEMYLVDYYADDQASIFWQRPYLTDSTWQLITSPFLHDVCDPVCAPKGTPCDDGNPATTDDMEDGLCNCVGTAVPVGFTVGERSKLEAYFFDEVTGGNIQTLLDDPDYPTMPDVMVNQMDGLLINWGSDLDEFGVLIEGYITVPETGCYDFNITGANEVAFLLSTDHDPANLNDSIFTYWGTGIFQHDHPDFDGNQTITNICLTANTYYYFKVLQVVPTWGQYLNVYWNGPQHQDDNWYRIPELFFYDFEDELACLPLGSPCNDGNPLTANDQIDASCECVGTPCTPNVDCDDPSADYSPYDYCETTDALDNRGDDAWISCTPIDNPYVPERSGFHWIHYDLGTEYLIGQTRVWNYNVAGQTGNGFQQVAVDYSLDGINWTHFDTYTWPLASGSSSYTGFDGPDFQGLQVRYVMFTSLDDPSQCRGISKITFATNLCPALGTACDDGDADTFNDHYRENCDCLGYTAAEMDCGLDTLFINASDMSPTSYHAIRSLMSSSNILDGGDVNYKAGMEIALSAGFEVSAGATLEASIEDCPEEFWSNPEGKKVFAIVDETKPKKLSEHKRPPTSLKVYNLYDRADQTIHMHLHDAGYVQLLIIDQQGNIRSTVVDHRYNNYGNHYKRIQTRQLAPGVYMIKMIVDGQEEYVDKMIVG